MKYIADPIKFFKVWKAEEFRRAVEKAIWKVRGFRPELGTVPSVAPNTSKLDLDYLFEQFYKGLLGRNPDKEGLNTWRTLCNAGETISSVLDKLVTSDEFCARFLSRYANKHFANDLDAAAERLQFLTQPWRAHHKARVQMIRELLPRADIIVDLGGAHSADERGALISYGYPYRPKIVHIVDLPLVSRFGGSDEKSKELSWESTKIIYHYSSMGNLSDFADKSVDLVLVGESIEHVERDEAHKVFEEVYRILKPGGRFCIDTPNRELTVLQVGQENFIHAEHQVEYNFYEFLEEFKDHGLELVRVKGLVYMPESEKLRRFLIEEYFSNAFVNDEPQNSYLFYCEYIKPCNRTFKDQYGNTVGQRYRSVPRLLNKASAWYQRTLTNVAGGVTPCENQTPKTFGLNEDNRTLGIAEFTLSTEKKISFQYKDHFLFQRKRLHYSRIKFNQFTERCVEVPIAFDFLANHADKGKMLEVGNVLSHYENQLSDIVGIRGRRIVDKFEVLPGVENVDLMDLPSHDQYDVIISISTVEHVAQGPDPSGVYGESTRSHNLEAPLKAIAKIYDLLSISGEALITVPFGRLTKGGWYIQFNKEYLDLLVSKYGIPKQALSVSYLRKKAMEPVGENPQQLWEETKEEYIKDIEYNHPFPCANAVSVVRLKKLDHGFRLNLEASPTSLRYCMPILVGSLYHTGFVYRAEPDSDGVFFSNTGGFIFYGPYLKTPPGEYELSFALDADRPCSLRFDVTANIGQDILFETTVSRSVHVKEIIRLLPSQNHIEFRLFNATGSKVRILPREIMFRAVDNAAGRQFDSMTIPASKKLP